jgi:ADP-ribosylglycohydrolase
VLAAAAQGSTTVPLDAVWIGAGAAIFGALVAAVAAHLRLRSQLAAERERLNDQLAAEQSRLSAQLEHEAALDAARARRERENELRTVLAQAAVRLTETISVLDDLRIRMSELQAHDVEPLDKELEQLWKNQALIAVSLGGDADEVKHYSNAVAAVTDARNRFHAFMREGADQSEFDAIRQAIKTAFECEQAFTNASARRIGPGASAIPS